MKYSVLEAAADYHLLIVFLKQLQHYNDRLNNYNSDIQPGDDFQQIIDFQLSVFSVMHDLEIICAKLYNYIIKEPAGQTIELDTFLLNGYNQEDQ